MSHNTTRNVLFGKLRYVMVLACALCVHARAYAHPQAAEAPTFASADCVTVVDKASTSELEFFYMLAYDDVMNTTGDIALRDAKTHQFFAFAGTVFPNGQNYELYPFAVPAVERAISVPLWITVDDVVRAAHASQDASVMFAAADVPPETVLENDELITGRWWRITGDADRRPIRVSQSLRPVRWNLQDVPSGVYTLAGYVFSPPYNDWSTSRGVVKIKDAQHDPPAGVIAPVVDSVFSYEGHRIKGCLDVPDGTKLSAYYQLQDSADVTWHEWADAVPAATGPLDLCFHTDARELAGSLRMRVDLQTPDGVVTSLHSRDTFTWLQGSGACVASESTCCDFPGARGPVAASADAGATGAMDAGETEVADAGAPEGDARAVGKQARRSRGCAVTALSGGVGGVTPCPWCAWCAWCAWLALWAVRRRLHARREACPGRR